MPKNPVRAARKAGRQEVRTAKVASRQAERTMKTTAKVEKIANKTASKIAKINDGVATRALKEPAMKMESKGMTKVTPSAKTPAPAAKGPTKTTPRSMTEVAKGMKPAKTTPTPKTKTPAPASKKMSPAVELAMAKKKYEDYKKQQEQGTYVTKPEDRNAYQKIKAKGDQLKKTVNDLKSTQDKALKESQANPKNESKYAESDRKAWAALNERRAKMGLPPMKRKDGGSVKKYNYGGMKGKKC